MEILLRNYSILLTEKMQLLCSFLFLAIIILKIH